MLEDSNGAPMAVPQPELEVAAQDSESEDGPRRSRRKVNKRSRIESDDEGGFECADSDCSVHDHSEEGIIRCMGPSCTTVVCPLICSVTMSPTGSYSRSITIHSPSIICVAWDSLRGHRSTFVMMTASKMQGFV